MGHLYHSYVSVPEGKVISISSQSVYYKIINGVPCDLKSRKVGPAKLATPMIYGYEITVYLCNISLHNSI